MKVGCLGDVVFEVSENTIMTLNNVVWGGSANYSTHQRHLTNALTEFTGLNPDTITFDVVMSMYLGVDPIEQINTIWTYEREGTAVPLVIGEKGYGKYRWNIVSHSMKMEQYLKDGSCSSATVSISLQEYLKE